MPTAYNYKVRDGQGNLVTGELVGDSEDLVMVRLRQMGLTPVEVKKANAGMKMEINLRPGHVKLKHLSIFARQFATMINSGLPILRALAILSEQSQSKELAKVLFEVRTDVEQGASLSGAMSKHPKAFSDLFIAMVKSGETGGVLDSVLLRLADMIEDEVELRRKIKSAMTYPIAVVALVLLIMSAMLFFVVPQFESIYAQLGGTLPLPTRVLLGVSKAVRKYWYIVILFSAASVFVFRRVKNTPQGRQAIDGFKLKVPIFGVPGNRTVLEHARNASALRRADPPGARYRQRDGQQQGHLKGSRGRPGQRSRRRDDRQAAQ